MSYAFFSADGNYVAAAGTKADVYVFSAETLKRIQTVSVGAGDVADPVSFSPDDKTPYTVDATDRELYDLDIATGTTAHRYTLPADTGLGYSFGSGVLGTYTADGTVAEYEMASDKLYAQVKNPGNSPIAAVRPDGDGHYVLISDTNGASYLVDALSKQVVGTFHYRYPGSGGILPTVSLDGNTAGSLSASTARTPSRLRPPSRRWWTSGTSRRGPMS